MSKFLNWFGTPAGRKTVGIIVTGSGGGMFLVQYLSQTVFLKSYFLELVGMRKRGKPLLVTPKLQQLFDEVTEDLAISEKQKKTLQPFMVFGFDVWHAGCLKTRYGTLVGLPTNFTYADQSSVFRETISVHEDVIDWNRDDAKQLADALILSEDAKKYAIAREILASDNYSMPLNSSLAGLLIGGCYGFTAHMNDTLKNFEKSRFVRILFYGLTASFFWGIYTMQKDAITRWIEGNVDEKIAELGPNYIKGGLEFYEKLSKRNAALRTLLGREGDNLYTVNGNDKVLLRQKHLPISYRKQFFETKLNSLETIQPEFETEIPETVQLELRDEKAEKIQLGSTTESFQTI